MCDVQTLRDSAVVRAARREVATCLTPVLERLRVDPLGDDETCAAVIALGEVLSGARAVEGRAARSRLAAELADGGEAGA
ncbi:hypothetical protein [uncultured Cellulomonas sp.]|uniref:hypothetical protein n=1 Tax=uncultured Cellulomonas sp. TaxID=189682 RepID=UPI0026323267|nr:hypothetical protein [uncultured Cellulomonas sp.]